MRSYNIVPWVQAAALFVATASCPPVVAAAFVAAPAVTAATMSKWTSSSSSFVSSFINKKDLETTVKKTAAAGVYFRGGALSSSSSSSSSSSTTTSKTAAAAAAAGGDTPDILPDFASLEEYEAYMETKSALPKGFASGTASGTFISQEAPALGKLGIRATVIYLTQGSTENWAATFTKNKVSVRFGMSSCFVLFFVLKQ